MLLNSCIVSRRVMIALSPFVHLQPHKCVGKELNRHQKHGTTYNLPIATLHAAPCHAYWLTCINLHLSPSRTTVSLPVDRGRG